jgi:RimJ/RimL family protein N-acetyltransferase
VSEDDVAAAAGRVRAALPAPTGHVVLRPVSAADVPAVHAYRSRPEVTAYLGHPPLDLTGARTLVRSWLDDARAVAAGIEVEGRLVGDVRLTVRASSAQAPARTGEVEGWLGYAVHPDVQGRGLATEAVRGMVRLAMGPGRVRRLTTRVFAPAVASSRLLARLGFTHEGTERAAVLAPDGTWWDDQWWSLLREEWQERAPGRRCDAGEGPTGALLWKAW